MTSASEPRPSATSPSQSAKKLARGRLVTALMMVTLSVIWVIIAARFYFEPPLGGVQPYLWGILGAVSLVNAFAHGLGAWFVQRGSRWGHTFAVMLVSANLVFTFTDQMGTSDWIMLGFNAVTLGMLIWTGPRKPATA